MDKTSVQATQQEYLSLAWHTVEKFKVAISAQLAVNYMYDMFTTTKYTGSNLLSCEEIWI